MTNKLLVGCLVTGMVFGCAGGKWTTTSTVNGKTTVTSSDPEEQKRIDAQAAHAEAYRKAIDGAERRKPSDPIHVVVFETVVADKLQQAGGDRIHGMLMKELQSIKDPVIVWVDPKLPKRKSHRLQDAIEEARSRGVHADIWVMPVAYVEDMVGINRATGKLASAAGLTFKAEMVSAYGNASAQPAAKGHILKNVQVIKDTARNIHRSAVHDLGPQLPSREAVARINQEYNQKAAQELADRHGIKPGDDKATVLRKLFSNPPQAAKTEAGE
jgi:hypothetical protein